MSYPLAKAERPGSSIEELRARLPDLIGLDGEFAYVKARTESGGQILAVPLSGGSPELIATTRRPPGSAAMSGRWIIWSEDASIHAATVSSRGGEEVRTIAETDLAPYAFVIDEPDIYWTAYNENAIARVALEGGAPARLATTTSPTKIAVDADILYWLSGEHDGSIISVAKRGGQGRALVTNQSFMGSLAVDATRIYWTTEDGSVKSAAKSGAEETVLARGQDRPGNLVIDDEHVYWTTTSSIDARDSYSPTFTPGMIFRVGKTGGQVELLASGRHGASNLRVRDGWIYWTTLDRLFRMRT